MAIACLPLLRRLELPDDLATSLKPGWRSHRLFSRLAETAQLMGPLVQRDPVRAYQTLRRVAREGWLPSERAWGAQSQGASASASVGTITSGSGSGAAVASMEQVDLIARLIFANIRHHHARCVALRAALLAPAPPVDPVAHPLDPAHTKRDRATRRQQTADRHQAYAHFTDSVHLLSDLLHSLPTRAEALHLAWLCFQDSTGFARFRDVRAGTSQQTTDDCLVQFLITTVLLPTTTDRGVDVDLPAVCGAAVTHLLASVLSLAQPSSSYKYSTSVLLTRIKTDAEAPPSLKNHAGGCLARTLLDAVAVPEVLSCHVLY